MTRYERYIDYLKSDHWRSLRRLKYEEVGRRCQVCSYGGVPQTHHIRYKNLVDCVTSDLVVLCVACHNLFHKACAQLKVDPLEKELPAIAAIVEEALKSTGSERKRPTPPGRPINYARRAKRKVKMLARLFKKTNGDKAQLADLISKLQYFHDSMP